MRWDPSISLGTLVQIAFFAATAAAFLWRWDRRLTILETKFDMALDLLRASLSGAHVELLRSTGAKRGAT